ncbi:homing endonuclease associated repeat-containing protein [Natronomonas sp. EA1]|uniref:homing endonuclease associated repeat-containing protein n=1 Tax=Natronomonas sp. EA1 TaxID=3421655 RepID=UPI003EB8E74C
MTERDCLAALREAAAELGESPTKTQYEALGLTPASGTIIRVCGGWNAAKEQAGLATNPSRGSRVGSKPSGLDISDEEWAAMSVDQRWHYRHVETNRERTLDRRQRLRAWLHIHKSSLGCSQCDEDDPACLDFHHVRGEKELAVNKMVVQGYSAEAIHAEIEKCEILCANCHRATHQHDSDRSGLIESLSGDVRTLSPTDLREMLPPLDKRESFRVWTSLHRSGAGCRRCSTDEAVSLDYHHPGEKSATVSRLISDGCDWQTLRDEIEKCVVLCANCHRKEHYRLPAPLD